AGAWPPRPGTRLVDRADRVFRNLTSLVSHERLASSPTHALETVFRMVAPNRFSYRIAGGGPEAVVIGRRRWDPPAPPAPLPPRPARARCGEGVPARRGVGPGAVAGPLAGRVPFSAPATPAWFELAVDKRTPRTLEQRMVTTSHFMRDVYGPFTQPIEIVPPA